MDRSQEEATIIDMDERGSRRLSVVTAIILVLTMVVIIAPFVVSDGTEPGETPGVSRQAGQAAPPAICRLNFDVPTMLDPVAQIVLPGWTFLCDWLSQPDFAEPLAPEG